ncbi:MAG: hypothetical protein V3T83_09385, partial [Acidobacteriota bacterium]
MRRLKTIYFDTSIFNALLDDSKTESSLVNFLERDGFKPALGKTVLDELALCFPRDAQRACALFSKVEKIADELTFLTAHWKLFEQEVDQLRTGAMVVPFLNYLDRTSMLLQIRRLAAGNSDDAVAFIGGDNKSDREGTIRQNEQDLREIDRCRDSNPRLRSFDEVRNFFEDQFPRLIG